MKEMKGMKGNEEKEGSMRGWKDATVQGAGIACLACL